MIDLNNVELLSFHLRSIHAVRLASWTARWKRIFKEINIHFYSIEMQKRLWMLVVNATLDGCADDVYHGTGRSVTDLLDENVSKRTVLKCAPSPIKLI